MQDPKQKTCNAIFYLSTAQLGIISIHFEKLNFDIALGHGSWDHLFLSLSLSLSLPLSLSFTHSSSSHAVYTNKSEDEIEGKDCVI